MERRICPYTPRGPPSTPSFSTGAAKQKTQAEQRQMRQRTGDQIQLPAQGPAVAVGGQAPQPTQVHTSHPVQTHQTTAEGTPLHDQQKSGDKRSKKSRVSAVTASVQTTAESSKR
jgi:hypothetical protein